MRGKDRRTDETRLVLKRKKEHSATNNSEDVGREKGFTYTLGEELH